MLEKNIILFHYKILDDGKYILYASFHKEYLEENFNFLVKSKINKGGLDNE